MRRKNGEERSHMTTRERQTHGEQIVEKAREQAGAAPPMEAPHEQAERTLNDSLRHMIESVRPEVIFGSPIDREGATVIPCAEVMTGFGMGGGSGFGPATTPAGQAERTDTPAGGPSGGGGIGGGGGAQGRPVAAIVIAHGQARVLPIVDATKFMIAGLTTAGFIAFWLTQSLARTKAPRGEAFSAARFARAMRGNRR
jgi:uncharacterized spore protein YtfJ